MPRTHVVVIHLNADKVTSSPCQEGREERGYPRGMHLLVLVQVGGLVHVDDESAVVDREMDWLHNSPLVSL